MAVIEINANPSKRDLYWFGGLFAVFTMVAASIAYWRFASPTAATWILGIGISICVVFFAVPPVRRYLYLGCMYGAFPIGWTVSLIILALTYYLVLTPTGLLMRLVGNDPMTRKLDAEADSYWIERTAHKDKARYFRQS